ncbi:MAG: polysaccharide deacetylase family protein [Clostridia bacterium]
MKRKCIALLSTVIMVFSFFAFPVSAENTQTDPAASDTQSADNGTDSATTEKKGGLMALTFDDGPSKNTIKLLDELKKRNIQATFFVVGERLDEFSDVLLREYNEGHEIGNHTWDHLNLTSADSATANASLQQTEDKVNEIVGANIDPLIIRPTYGAVNDTVRGYVDTPLILWSIDTLDWKSRDADAVKQQIINQACDGAIILLHDLYDTSVDGAIAAIDELTKEGYTFVTVSELFRRKGETMEVGVTYTNAEDNDIDLGPLPEKEPEEEKTEDKDKDKKETEREDKGFPWGWLIFCAAILLIYAAGLLRSFGMIPSPTQKRKDKSHEKTADGTRRRSAGNDDRRASERRRNSTRRRK